MPLISECICIISSKTQRRCAFFLSAYIVAQQADMAGSCRIVVMASGKGSNFQALIDAVNTQRIRNSQIVRLFVNRKNAYAVKRAENAGIPCIYFNLISGDFQAKGEKDPGKQKEARSKYDAALAEVVLQDAPDLVILAGWMHVFTYDNYHHMDGTLQRLR